MKIRAQIRITSANLMQVFKLPCVSAVHKGAEDKFGDYDVAFTLCPAMLTEEMHNDGWFKAAFIGDILVEFDNHKWRVWRTRHSHIDESMRRLMQSSEPRQLELFPED